MYLAQAPLPRYPAQHVYVGELRYYQLPDGALSPGVTTVLGLTKDAEQLERWKERHSGEAIRTEDDSSEAVQVVGEEALIITPYHQKIISEARSRRGWWDGGRGAWVVDRRFEDEMRGVVFEVFGATTNLAGVVSERARNRGTGLHARIEAFLQGLPQPDDDLALAAEPYWLSAIQFVETIKDVMLIEGAVWHPEGWAGSIDCIAWVKWPGTEIWVLAIADWKTADREKQWRYIADYRQQVAAYAAAANRIYQQLGIRIGHGVVVIAIPNRPPQLFYLNPTTLRAELQVFRERLTRFQQATTEVSCSLQV